MVDHELVPDGDILKEWTSTGEDHWEEINEDKGAPVIEDYIGATEDDDSDIDEFILTSAVITNNIVNAVVWLYYSDMAAKLPDVDFYDGNAWRGYQTAPDPDGTEWESVTFAGLDMDQTDVDNARIRFRAHDTIAKMEGCQIFTVYVIITEGIPSGPSDILEISGIPIANIDEKMGIAWGDIDEINGIT